MSPPTNGENGTAIGGNVYPSSSPHSPVVDIKPTIVKRRKTLDGKQILGVKISNYIV